MTDPVNRKAMIRLPLLVARVDRAMAATAAVQAVLVFADFLLLGLLVGGAPPLQASCLVVFGIVGPAIGTTRHFRVAARDGAGLVIASTTVSLAFGILYYFVPGGLSDLRVAVGSGAPVIASVFELSVTLHLVAVAATLLFATLAFRRRTSVLSIGRIPG